jgi:uncharacterized membrane protein YfcA
VIVFSAGALAGAVNSVAGGGTLILYPVLLASGLTPISANVTSLVGLLAGYIGGAHAYRTELFAERKRMQMLLTAAIFGSVAGAALLLLTPVKVFEAIIPYLILFASSLLFFQPHLSRVFSRGNRPTRQSIQSRIVIIMCVFIGSIYGAYFSAGVGVLLVALLSLTLRLDFQKINAIKNGISLVVVLTSISIYAFSGQVNWLYVLFLLPASGLGGLAGGKFARKLNANVLRYVISFFGILISLILFSRT